MKKIITLFFIILLIFSQFAFAENLLSEEAVTYFNEGVKAQNKGDFDRAYTAYQKALLLNPGYQKIIFNNLGVMFVFQGDLEKAKAGFQEVLSFNPDYKPALFNLGLLHYMRGDQSEALQYWLKYFDIGELGFRSFMMEKEQQPPQKEKTKKP